MNSLRLYSASGINRIEHDIRLPNYFLRVVNIPEYLDRQIATHVVGFYMFWDVFWPALGVAVFIWMWRTGKIGVIKQYILETREQLRKSTWPTREELKQHIVVVMISSLLLAAFTFAADFLLREIVWGALMDSKTVIFKGADQ